jgi:hypothetical protein
VQNSSLELFGCAQRDVEPHSQNQLAAMPGGSIYNGQ